MSADEEPFVFHVWLEVLTSLINNALSTVENSACRSMYNPHYKY